MKSTANNNATDSDVRDRRARALLTATISTFDNALSTPCLVSNISSSGARVTISASIPLGAEFKIAIPQRSISRAARQIWREGDVLGLAFQPEARVADVETSAEKDVRILALEAENLRLKSEIGGLKHLLFRRDEA